MLVKDRAIYFIAGNGVVDGTELGADEYSLILDIAQKTAKMKETLEAGCFDNGSIQYHYGCLIVLIVRS